MVNIYNETPTPVIKINVDLVPIEQKIEINFVRCMVQLLMRFADCKLYDSKKKKKKGIFGWVASIWDGNSR